MTNWEKSIQNLNISGIATFDNVPDNIINYLKKSIKRKKNLKFNKGLLGHIKEEYLYSNIPEKIKQFFIEKIFENSILKFHLDKIDILTKNAPLVLDKLWCNFMKKYEFNPLHGHSGVFSFIIFLKIPYDLQKEDKVFPEVNKIHLTSRLQFVTVSPTTGIQSIILDVDKSFENKMLIFPANFKHEVYPFYTSDEERITVSGNIKFFNG